MTTEKAFKKLLENPSICKGFISDSTVRSWRKRLADGGKITKDAMEEALLKIGAKRKPEKWTFPAKKS
jgi:hypothetical protein